MNDAWSENFILSLFHLDAILEKQMAMSAASMFWLDALHDCNIDRTLPLPFDRYRLSHEHRTGAKTSVCLELGEDLSQAFLFYAFSNGITPEQLMLTCYYAFLFKLTNGETDLCIAMNTNGRYREDLSSIIGMFVNTIPLRCQLNPYSSFEHLARNVKEIFEGSIEYSYFPLQRILDQHQKTRKLAFLETSFDFQTFHCHEEKKKEFIIGDSRLHLQSDINTIHYDLITNDSDFFLGVQHDYNLKKISCNIIGSLDVFQTKTIHVIAQRFHSMLEELFFDSSCAKYQSLNQLPIILPHEKCLIQSTNNVKVLFSPATCIHHLIASQASTYSQKLAVELDDQSLSYSELLYFSQLLSLRILEQEKVMVGDIICQCVERSLSMVSL